MFKKILLILCLMLLFTAGCSNGSTSNNSDNSSSDGSSNEVTNNATTTPDEFSVDYQFESPKKGDTIALMKTSMGDIKIRFFPKEAPKAVENFVKHSKDGYYDNVKFHRVMKDFMIQSGDPLGNGTGGESIWGQDFGVEISNKLHNFRGALAMANTGQPNSNGSQFYIVQASSLNDYSTQVVNRQGYNDVLRKKYEEIGGFPSLDGGYTVFGQVIEGMDVVDKIANVEVESTDPSDPNAEVSKPKSEVKILKVEISEQP